MDAWTMDQSIESRSYRRMRQIIFRALLIFILLSPLPFGGNLPMVWSLYAVFTALLTLIWVVWSIKDIQSVSVSLNPWIIMFFLAPCLWALLQTVSQMPATWVHPLWSMMRDALQLQAYGYISLTPDKTLTALMRLLTYGLVFFLSYQLCRDRENARSLIKWIAITGVLHALYGLIIQWEGFQTVWWLEKTSSLSSVTGTFINKNTFATFAGLTLICGAGLLIDDILRQVRKMAGQLMGRDAFVEYLVVHSWRPILGLMLIITALTASHSRGGIISTGLALIVLIGIFGYRSKLSNNIMLAAIAGVVAVTLFAYSISDTILLKGMEYISESAEIRMEAYEKTLVAIESNPWVGFGYGGFEEGFRLYRGEDISEIYHKAHNSYLEILFGLGLPATFSLLASIAGVMLMAMSGIRRRQRDWVYPAIGFAVTVLVAAHAMVDFSLQIPAVAITYAAIMGVSAAQSASSRRQSDT